MKKLISVILAGAIVLTAAGCNDSASVEPISGEDAAAENGAIKPVADSLEEIDVVLDWYPNAVHTFIYEAIDKGYYEEEGLKVNVLFPANANDPLSLTAAGKADIGLYYMEDLIVGRVNENVPVKAIGTVVRKPIAVIASLAEKGFTSPKDLEGTTVGINGTAFGEAAVISAVKNAGGDPDKVTMIDVGFDLISSMTTGNVAATYGCFVNHEIVTMEQEGIDTTCFYLSDYGVPMSYSLVFVAGDKNIAENEDKYARFMRASKRGFDDMKADPDAALALLLENQNSDNFPLTESVEKESFDILIPIMEDESGDFGSQSVEPWEESMNWLYEVGLINDTIDANEFLHNLEAE